MTLHRPVINLKPKIFYWMREPDRRPIRVKFVTDTAQPYKIIVMDETGRVFACWRDYLFEEGKEDAPEENHS